MKIWWLMIQPATMLHTVIKHIDATFIGSMVAWDKATVELYHPVSYGQKGVCSQNLLELTKDLCQVESDTSMISMMVYI